MRLIVFLLFHKKKKKMLCYNHIYLNIQNYVCKKKIKLHNKLRAIVFSYGTRKQVYDVEQLAQASAIPKRTL